MGTLLSFCECEKGYVRSPKNINKALRFGQGRRQIHDRGYKGMGGSVKNKTRWYGMGRGRALPKAEHKKGTYDSWVVRKRRYNNDKRGKSWE